MTDNDKRHDTSAQQRTILALLAGGLLLCMVVAGLFMFNAGL